MKRYPEERKTAVLAKMTGPNRKSIPELSREEKISEPTLYAWRKEARAKGLLLPDKADSPSGWSSTDKFNTVLQTAAFSEAELSEYCRSNGLYPQQVKAWRAACEQANDWDRAQNKILKQQRLGDQDTIGNLERELRRKEKALAEAAALLVLEKKSEAIWGGKHA